MFFVNIIILHLNVYALICCRQYLYDESKEKRNVELDLSEWTTEIIKVCLWLSWLTEDFKNYFTNIGLNLRKISANYSFVIWKDL